MEVNLHLEFGGISKGTSADRTEILFSLLFIHLRLA
jgi:hypothetical protein